MDVLHLYPKSSTPPMRQTTVAQLARDLGVDFRPESLQLTCIRLAREVESLRFRVALVEEELRRPLWRRVADRLTGSVER